MESDSIINFLNSQWPPSVLIVEGKAIEFNIKKQTLDMTFVAKKFFCHSGDIVQGGYISGMLDAVMAYSVIGLPNFKYSVSTRIGLRPALKTANAVEQYVIAGIITSELSGKFKDFKAIVNASVPLPQLIAYFDFVKSLKFFSN